MIFKYIKYGAITISGLLVIFLIVLYFSYKNTYSTNYRDENAFNKINTVVMENELEVEVLILNDSPWDLVCLILPYGIWEIEKKTGRKFKNIEWASHEKYWGLVFVNGNEFSSLKFDSRIVEYSGKSSKCWKREQAIAEKLRFIKTSIRTVLLKGD